MPRKRLVKLVVTLLSVLLLPGVLSSCYLPVRFQADVVISRVGYYDIAFAGQIAWAPLVRALEDASLSAAEETEKARLIERDLSRDSASRFVSYLGRGVFQLDWRQSGDLVETGMASFVRRGERLLALRYSKPEKTIELRGSRISAKAASELGAVADAVSGVINVYTDGPVVDHNATEVRETGDGVRLYRWRIESATDPSPLLVVALP